MEDLARYIKAPDLDPCRERDRRQRTFVLVCQRVGKYLVFIFLGVNTGFIFGLHALAFGKNGVDLYGRSNYTKATDLSGH